MTRRHRCDSSISTASWRAPLSTRGEFVAPRQFHNTVFSIFLRCNPSEEDLLTAELWEQNTSGIADEPGGVRAFFSDDELVPEILKFFRRWAPELRIEPDVNWDTVWQDAWPPMLVGERFFLVPTWRSDPTPAGRLRLDIYPGMACGTGRHPATQLCLEAMERYVQPGGTVVDIGSGSGILSAAAQLLGASRVIACDIDHDTVKIACQRVGVPFFTGSAEAVQSGCATVIVANINSETIERLRHEFERIRNPERSVVILSGFPEWDPVEGFHVTQMLRRAGWLCVISANH